MHATDRRTSDSSTPLGVLYTVEGLGSIGGNLLQVGIFFYTNHVFGWGLRENFTLAAAQGVVYVVGALLAHGVATRVPPRAALAVVYALLCAISLSALLSRSPATLVAAVLAYTAVMGIGWPILESMVSVGLDAHALSKRISVYNLVWAGTGALTVATNGAIIEHWPSGVFAITGIVHGISSLLMSVTKSPDALDDANACATTAPVAEAELLRVRTLALWLSRISVPASYALIYALSALLPSLPTMQQIPTWTATFVGSTWLIARWLAFLLLGFSAWWHTRPRWLISAAWVMLAGFVGVAWTPSKTVAPGNLTLDIAWLVACQVAIGFAIGMIYSASLYFGMVLSEGSTEHSGYHEALIGLGSILGPGAGALAQWLRPNQMLPGVLAVAAVLLLSSMLATAAPLRTRGDTT